MHFENIFTVYMCIGSIRLSLCTQENERLYAELTRCQKESKLEQARLFKENQRLASEVLNTRYAHVMHVVMAGTMCITTEM